MAPRTTRAERPSGDHVLVYDGGCPFCTASAHWLQRHARVPVRLMTFDEVEGSGMLTLLTRSHVEAAAHFVTPDGLEYHAGAAVTRSLRLTRVAPIAALLDLPGLSVARDAGYTAVTYLRPILSRFLHP